MITRESPHTHPTPPEFSGHSGSFSRIVAIRRPTSPPIRCHANALPYTGDMAIVVPQSHLAGVESSARFLLILLSPPPLVCAPIAQILELRRLRGEIRDLLLRPPAASSPRTICVHELRTFMINGEVGGLEETLNYASFSSCVGIL